MNNDIKLIKGNWYKSSFGNYFKFYEARNGYNYYSEYIVNKEWRRLDRYLVGGFGEINLEEIQEYLPEGHPDKINQIIKLENTDYLIEFLENLQK